MQKSKSKNLIILIAVLVALIAVGVVVILLNTRADKIPANPLGTIGNAAGNINNGGYFCEKDGVVYFANSFDSNTLYKMNVDESDVTKISSAKVSNLLIGGSYLYYFQSGVSGASGLGGVRTPNSFNRCKLDGSKATCLVRSVVVSGQLVNDTLYLLTSTDEGSYLFSIGTDKSNETKLTNYILNPASAADGTIYYNGTVSDHYLYAFNTDTNNASQLANINMWYPSVEGNYVYYMDLDRDYALCRYNLTQREIEILTSDKVQSFNVGNGYIYYQTMGNTPGLYMMRADGSGNMKITDGQYMDISMTSGYVYFRDYFEPTNTYHAFLGSPYFELFYAASEAVAPAH